MDELHLDRPLTLTVGSRYGWLKGARARAGSSAWVRSHHGCVYFPWVKFKADLAISGESAPPWFSVILRDVVN